MSVMNKTAVRSGQWFSTCLKPPGRNPAWQWAAAAEGPGLRTGRLVARGMPPGTLPPPGPGRPRKMRKLTRQRGAAVLSEWHSVGAFFWPRRRHMLASRPKPAFRTPSTEQPVVRPTGSSGGAGLQRGRPQRAV